MRILLNERELSALRGLSHGAVALYVLLLRPLMDLGSGLVGVRSAVSWGGLALRLAPDPVPGVPRARVSISAARRRAQELERAGLVRVRGDREARRLVLRLELAARLSRGRDQADSQAGAQADRPPAATPRGKTSSRPRARPTGRPTGRAASVGAVVRSKTSPHHAPRELEHQAPAQAQGGGGRFHFPQGLAPRAQERLAHELEGLGQAEGQELLDELGAALERGRVGYPVRYLRALIGQAREGRFIAEHAHRFAATRRARQEALARQAREAEERREHKPASKAAARPHLEKMRAIVGRSR